MTKRENMPERLTVTLHKALPGERIEPCICSAGRRRPQPAFVRVIVTGENRHSRELPEWSWSVWRCPAGAGQMVYEVRQEARLSDIPFEVYDETKGLFLPGELGI